MTPYTTVEMAIMDLPCLEAGEGIDSGQPYGTAPQNSFQTKLRQGCSGVRNHVAMGHTQRLVERFMTIGHGKSLKDVGREHGQIKYRKAGAIAKKPFKYNNYRLDPNKPALTIPASFQSLFLHPHLHRNLTAREAARLFGYPDNYVFQGKRTAMSWEKHLSQYNQIGNSVSPLMSFALGKALTAALQKDECASIVYRPVSIKLNSSIEVIEPHIGYNPPKRLTETLSGLIESTAKKLGFDSGRLFTAMEKGRLEPAWLGAAIALPMMSECPVFKITVPP